MPAIKHTQAQCQVLSWELPSYTSPMHIRYPAQDQSEDQICLMQGPVNTQPSRRHSGLGWAESSLQSGQQHEAIKGNPIVKQGQSLLAGWPALPLSILSL